MKKESKKNSPKNVALVYRLASPAAVTLAKTLSTWLKKRGHNVFTGPTQKAIAGTTLIKTKPQLDKVNLMVVLGGDGTYLRAVRMLEGRPIPVLGINLGSLGFLTTTKSDEAFTAVEHALDDKMTLQKRTMLSVTIKRKNRKPVQMLALNDVVLERGSLAQLINISISVGKEFVSDVKADGLILSSPTGSTAYNVAAGGPLTHPDAKIFIVTPIAPHSLTTRPMIFSDKTKITFKLVGKLQKQRVAHLVIDGQKVTELTSDDVIQISESKMNHYLMEAPDHSYFHLLREKLKFGDRA